MAEEPDPTTLPKPYERSRIAQPRRKPILCVNDPQGHPVLSDLVGRMIKNIAPGEPRAMAPMDLSVSHT